MGPQASAYLYNLLIQKAISDFGVEKDDQFPEIIIYSVTVPNFISNKKSVRQALKILEDRIKQINKLDISSLSIACNTAHLILPQLEEISKIPFTSMITEVVKSVQSERRNKIGLLGTPTTIRAGIYQNQLSDRGIETVLPEANELPKLEKVIRNVLRGKRSERDVETLKKIAMRLKVNGAEGIILGCTELPLIFPKQFSLPIFNSLDILAVNLLKKYYGKR